jgi:hypothetical protein
LRERLERALVPSIKTIAVDLMKNAADKIRYFQNFSLVSVYGTVLAKALPTSPVLSSQVECVENGKFPLPIYATAVLDEVKNQIVTAEFTPLFVEWKDRVIPPAALGCRFNHGSTVESFPEVPMSDLLGIFGSAFCTTIETIMRNAFWIGGDGADKLKNFVHESLVDNVWSTFQAQLKRVGVDNREYAVKIPAVYPLHLNNWSFDSHSSEATPTTVAYFDGGIDSNMPWKSALKAERAIDVVIALDYADDIYGGGDAGFLTLRALRRYRQEELDAYGKTRIPEIDLEGMGTRKIKVFGSAEKGELEVIYIPLKPASDDAVFDPAEEMGPLGFCNVTNFKFSHEQFDLLYNLSRDNMELYSPDIADTIERVMMKTAPK